MTLSNDIDTILICSLDSKANHSLVGEILKLFSVKLPLDLKKDG